MEIKFRDLIFEVTDDNSIILKSYYGIGLETDSIYYKTHNFVEVQVLGENKNSHLGNNLANSSEGLNFKYVSHELNDNSLIIKLKSNLILATVNIFGYDDTNTIRVNTEIENISDEPLTIEELSIFKLPNLGSALNTKNLYFTKFCQSHATECQPRRFSFFDYGLTKGNFEGQNKISHTNIGSWSTKEELPQGIIETNNKFIMFEIESSSNWHYEIADKWAMYYLYLGGNNFINNNWFINLNKNEKLTTNYSAISFGENLNEVVGMMTKYRRHIYFKNELDKDLPAIFNEYMHLSWDNPGEKKAKLYAETVKETGVKYYVIDCGWHDEEDSDIIYHYVGKWTESKKRFSKGIKATVNYLHSLGLKVGLWIEPEIVGYKNQELIDFYGDDAFIRRNGKKVLVMNRYFLDYRNPKVVNYMGKVFDRMINEYKVDYIKMDYNQDQGVGTDEGVSSYGEGLESTTKAFFDFLSNITNKYKNVLFEGCASGGMRLDYHSLSHYSLVSTSDQVDALKYPYIAGNIISAVLPEQAAVWSYPVSNPLNYDLAKDVNWVHENISDEYVSLNMINSFLGRMHLASDLRLLKDSQKELIKEGVRFYDSLTKMKKESVPYFPLGFTKFYETHVASGLESKENLLLTIYNLNGDKHFEVNIKDFKNIESFYPKNTKARISIINNKVVIDFDKDIEAIAIMFRK